MPRKTHDYVLSHELLTEYRDAALENAHLLVDEARILLEHERLPRAYFLSVSSIEEAGKAALAHDGLRRDFGRQSVATRLKLHFEDHSQKMTAAFAPWLQESRRPRHELQSIVDIVVDIQFGREAAMYTDVHRSTGRVTLPTRQIRPQAASDCVRLAGDVVARIDRVVSNGVAQKSTQTEDEYFAIKPREMKMIIQTSDFWEYYLQAADARPFEVVFVEYRKEYFARDRRFSEAASTAQSGDA